MAKITKNTANLFGESFIASQRLFATLKARRENLEQELNFRRRALTLDEAFRRDDLAIEEARDIRAQKKFNFDVSQQFTPIEQVGETQRVNPKTGELDFTLGGQLTSAPLTTGQQISDTFGAEIGAGNFIRNDLIPQIPETPVTLQSEGIDKGQRILRFGDRPGNISRVQVNNLPSGILNDGRAPKGEKPFKEGKLSAEGTKALNYLTNPDNLASGFIQNILGTGVSSVGEVKAEFNSNLRTFMKDIVGSNTTRWVFQNIDKKGRFLSPGELNELAIKEVEKGDLSEDEIDTFLNFYETIYKGVQRLDQQR